MNSCGIFTAELTIFSKQHSIIPKFKIIINGPAATNPHREPLKFLVFSASLRNDSLNTKLAKLAAVVIEKNGATADFAYMSEFDCPSYNQDLETKDLPDGAIRFRKRLLEADAFIIASPEYNGSMPGYLKNTIDWVSRFRPQPFNESHALLMSASPSMAGGNRALWSLRCHWNTSAQMFSRICFPWQLHTKHLQPKENCR
jgi:NAD(P)H-dependent FMN reductase